MRSRTLAALLASMLLSAACGARLTNDQRDVAVGGLQGGGGPDGTIAPTTGPDGAVPTDTPTGGATNGPTTAPTDGGTAAAGCGGQGGATDVGITDTAIKLGVVSNITGIQPGLFKSTHQAMQAVAAYINSEGGICERQVQADLRDDNTNSGGNRSAILAACEVDFALVGSMSAFDDGGASAVDSCGIPDISAITVNPARVASRNSYPAYPVRTDYFLVGTANYIKKTYPDVIKNAAILWLDAGVTRVNADARRRGYQAAGFNFVYQQAVQVLEANYGPYVQQMKERGVQYVTMVADYQSIVRLLKAMRDQTFKPKVLDWDSVVYSPSFGSLAGSTADGSLFFINTAMLEEASGNAEMQLYTQWLQRVAPGAVPDYFGLYAWSAGRMFQDVATKIGKDLTRKKVLSALAALHAWDGHGLHVTHDVGANMPSNCFLYGKVNGGRFSRFHPSSKWDCSQGPLLRL